MDRKVILIGALGGAQACKKNAATPYGAAANVTMDQRTLQRANDSISADNAENFPLFSDVKAFATLQASFALCGWQLEPDPRIDGSTAYLVSRWGRMRVLNDLDQVRALLAEIGGVT